MTQVLGFKFSGVVAGIKKKAGTRDFGLIYAEQACNAAAVFTRNLVRASPVHLAEERVLSGKAQALLVNAGNANACTGPAGMEAALLTTKVVADALGIAKELVLPSSTGVIGQALPTQKMVSAVPALVAELSAPTSDDRAGLDHFAEAICTTDRWKKIASAQIESGGKTAQILAIGKGAGMFHPDLALAGQLPKPDGTGFSDMDFAGLHATMLVYILTDADVDTEMLREALLGAADRTFNASTVDGDTSTNDSVFLLASGLSGVKPSFDEFTQALTSVCSELAREMVRDGEGANHAVTITVRGLQNDAEARDVARSVATSPLVKTAINGKDANWGRLLMAAGKAGIPFDPDRAMVSIGGVCICENGQLKSAEADLAAGEAMKAAEYTIELTLGGGPGTFSYITSDLGHAYVDVNATYRS
jgi:glutamate N-acetyltransferase / amino-acid N-acetyltransferase